MDSINNLLLKCNGEVWIHIQLMQENFKEFLWRAEKKRCNLMFFFCRCCCCSLEKI